MKNETKCLLEISRHTVIANITFENSGHQTVKTCFIFTQAQDARLLLYGYPYVNHCNRTLETTYNPLRTMYKLVYFSHKVI